MSITTTPARWEALTAARFAGAEAERERILAWLDASPADWPWTGADIALFIRNGCKPWIVGEPDGEVA